MTKEHTELMLVFNYRDGYLEGRYAHDWIPDEVWAKILSQFIYGRCQEFSINSINDQKDLAKCTDLSDGTFQVSRTHGSGKDQILLFQMNEKALKRLVDVAWIRFNHGDMREFSPITFWRDGEIFIKADCANSLVAFHNVSEEDWESLEGLGDEISKNLWDKKDLHWGNVLK